MPPWLLSDQLHCCPADQFNRNTDGVNVIADETYVIRVSGHAPRNRLLLALHSELHSSSAFGLPAQLCMLPDTARTVR